MRTKPLLRGIWFGLLAAAIASALIALAADRPAALLRAIAYLSACCFMHRPAWRTA
jgi:hypothetical protein